jgi:hypothetical protein
MNKLLSESTEIEAVAAALFDKIRTRFPNVTLGDEGAKAVTDPSKARFFNFAYVDDAGTEFGKVTISLIDEESIKVYYGQNISGDMDRDQRKAWYEFLRNIRQFAKRNLMTFDTRDINKSNLNIADVKQQAKTDTVATVDDVPVTESKLRGTPGRPYNSIGDAGSTKILVRHKDKINDEVRGARSRHIQEIFLETERGERFLLNHTNLHGAYAMAENINQGGTLHDEVAEHINELVAEMAAMRHFVRSTKHRQFEDQETADMTQAAVHQYDKVKRTLKQMRGARGFRSYFETFTAPSPIEDEVDVESLRERFVKKVYDERFNDALPYVYRAYQQQKSQPSGNLGSELDEWAQSVTESSENGIDPAAVQEYMKTTQPAGISGIDAVSDLEQLLGSHSALPELTDAVQDYAEDHGPDADVRSLVKVWLNEYVPGLMDDIEVGQNNVDNASSNFPSPVSPKQAQPNDQFAATSIDESAPDDGLDFLRGLAGLKR